MKFCRPAEFRCLRYSTKPNSAVSAEFQSTGIYDIFSDRGLPTFVSVTRFNARAVKIMVCTYFIICCPSSPGISGNHDFIKDFRLCMIGTLGEVIKFPFIVE